MTVVRAPDRGVLLLGLLAALSAFIVSNFETLTHLVCLTNNWLGRLDFTSQITKSIAKCYQLVRFPNPPATGESWGT